jgi:hypothetical protein
MELYQKSATTFYNNEFITMIIGELQENIWRRLQERYKNHKSTTNFT